MTYKVIPVLKFLGLSTQGVTSFKKSISLIITQQVFGLNSGIGLRVYDAIKNTNKSICAMIPWAPPY